jgi:hypothetical protein
VGTYPDDVTDLEPLPSTDIVKPDQIALQVRQLPQAALDSNRILQTRIMSGADIAAELHVSRATAHDYLHRLQGLAKPSALAAATNTGGISGRWGAACWRMRSATHALNVS